MLTSSQSPLPLWEGEKGEEGDPLFVYSPASRKAGE